jgi:hypothetical protein
MIVRECAKTSRTTVAFHGLHGRTMLAGKDLKNQPGT